MHFRNLLLQLERRKRNRFITGHKIRYLTKSSDFKDLRVAVENSANDLYGTDVKNAASVAFAAVGIGGSGGTGSDSQQDLKTNPGNDFIICTDEDYSALYLLDGNGNILKNPLSGTDIQSKPSIPIVDGKHVVFVRAVKFTIYIWIGLPGHPQNRIIGKALSGEVQLFQKMVQNNLVLKSEAEDRIHVYSYDISKWQEFELYNPSTARE